MKVLLALQALSPLILVTACTDGHGNHERSVPRRGNPSAGVVPPSRPLEWGDINILHTTDTHGWLLGHQKESSPEPNYSADFGDFASFVAHMKEQAIERDVDLLLVDSGDLHDGTGLTDGFPSGGVDAHDSNEFFKQLPYDVLAIGNHELYVYANALDMHKNFAPRFNGRYLSSNVNITISDKNGKAVSVPVGSRFSKFKTRKGRRVTSLGVLFDFTSNSANTTVQKVADMVKEGWFHEAIEEEPDLFLLVGHMPVSNDNWPLVFDAIRAVHPHTPIMIFGGHTHIRDCVQHDGRSMALQSGRYMETLGWLTAKLGPKGSKQDITFSRRYLDPNRVTYEFHTGRRGADFDTPRGKSITAGLKNLSKKFNLSFLFGTAPQDFTLSQSPFPSQGSLLTLLMDTVLPTVLSINNTRASIPHLILTNSGSQRFDIHAGPFTKNDQLTVSPFSNQFFFIPNITLSVANQILPVLNNEGERRRSTGDKPGDDLYSLGYVDKHYMEWLEGMDRQYVMGTEAPTNLTLGYVTHDSCPGEGDDTPHIPLPFYPIPAFISSKQPDVAEDTPIDLVFVDFIQAQLLSILNSRQMERTYTIADVNPYGSFSANEVFGVYAREKWN